MPLTLAAQDLVTSDPAVEEIVVTTRKREENLQEVPIAIGVFTAEDIQRAGIRDLADVTKLSPSLQFDKSYSDNSMRVTIRGLSNTRGRSNVAFLVDGIDVTSETTSSNAGSPMLVNQRLLADVERIEVVRGPQSALFGRSAFAGAINYVSKNPADELEWNTAVDIAQHDQQEIYAGVSGPVTDTLGFMLSGVGWNNDGYYENLDSGKGFGGGDGYGVAGTLRWEPVDTFSLKTRLTWSDDSYTPGAIAVLQGEQRTLQVPQEAIDSGVTSTTSVDLLRFAGDADGLEVHSSEDPHTGKDYPGNTLKVFRGSLIADWDIGAYTLSSYFGYTNADMSQRYDLDRQADGRPDMILGHGDVDTYGRTKQLSEELRLASNWENSAVQMTGGLQYWKEKRDDFSSGIQTTCYTSAACAFSKFKNWQGLYAEVEINAPDFLSPTWVDTEHKSAYVMLEWDISETVQFTVEDRFVWEDFNTTLAQWGSCANPFAFNANYEIYNFGNDTAGPTCSLGPLESGSVSSSFQTPKFTLEWQVSDEAMMYVLAGKGAKPAGISVIRVPIAPPPGTVPQPMDTFKFANEKMWSYELGAKTQWSGNFGAVLFNTAIFYQDYKDKQTNTQQEFNGYTIGVPTNASSAWVQGVEIETSWDTPLDGLSLGIGYTWLDSEYDDFKDPTNSAGRIAIAGDCGTVINDNGIPRCLIDLSGNELEFTPENSLVLSARYEHDLFMPGFNWYVESTGSYQSERHTSADTFTELDAFWLVDARFGVTSDRWNIIAYVDNVLDDDTISSSGGNTDVAAGYVDSGILVPPTVSTAFLPPPRTAGLRVQYSYR